MAVAAVLSVYESDKSLAASGRQVGSPTAPCLPVLLNLFIDGSGQQLLRKTDWPNARYLKDRAAVTCTTQANVTAALLTTNRQTPGRQTDA